MKRPFLRTALFAVIGLAIGAAAAIAQVPSTANVPYNSDVGAVITNTLRVAGDNQSASQTNLQYRGVVCTFNQTAVSGSPSTKFSIQAYDAATNSFYTLVTSGAITASSTPTPVAVYPGMQTASLPSGMVALGVHLPRVWRLSQTQATAGAATTGTIGCNYLN